MSARAQPRTIVVVDDQADFLPVVRARLTRGETLQVIAEATSGEAALELVPHLEPTPDAVVLDVEMPGLDGFETARRLRSLAPAVRIILTSASDRSGYGVAANGLGAAFLPKRNLTPEAVLHLLD